MNTKRRILETEIERKRRDFKMMTMAESHYGIILKTKGKKMVDVLFLEEKERELTSFKYMRSASQEEGAVDWCLKEHRLD